MASGPAILATQNTKLGWQCKQDGGTTPLQKAWYENCRQMQKHWKFH